LKVFAVHLWKDGPREIEDWVEVARNAKVLKRRFETPEEYHERPKNMVTVLILGRTFTFRIPWRN